MGTLISLFIIGLVLILIALIAFISLVSSQNLYKHWCWAIGVGLILLTISGLLIISEATERDKKLESFKNAAVIKGYAERVSFMKKINKDSPAEPISEWRWITNK